MEETMDNKVVKLVTRKVTETIVKEASEWKTAYDLHQKRQAEMVRLAEIQRDKQIGFKF